MENKFNTTNSNQYGYARVSTVLQKEDRQIIALKEFGVEDKNIFLDKVSGKDFNRPSYKRLLRKLRQWDTGARKYRFGNWQKLLVCQKVPSRNG